MRKLVPKSKLAERLGVSPQTVSSKFPKRHSACCDKTNHIDMEHPEVVEWIRKKMEQYDLTAIAKAVKVDIRNPNKRVTVATIQKDYKLNYTAASEVYDMVLDGEDETEVETEGQSHPEVNRLVPPDVEIFEVDRDVSEFPTYTVLEISQKFGTVERFKNYLDAMKKIAETEYKQIQNAEKMGHLIPREFVRTAVFGFIDASMSRLLSDTPRTLASSVHAMVKAGATKEEIEEKIHNVISSQIKDLKSKTIKSLK